MRLSLELLQRHPRCTNWPSFRRWKMLYCPEQPISVLYQIDALSTCQNTILSHFTCKFLFLRSLKFTQLNRLDKITNFPVHFHHLFGWAMLTITPLDKIKMYTLYSKRRMLSFRKHCNFYSSATTLSPIISCLYIPIYLRKTKRQPKGYEGELLQQVILRTQTEAPVSHTSFCIF